MASSGLKLPVQEKDDAQLTNYKKHFQGPFHENKTIKTELTHSIGV